jgi:uncharacterized protein (DUF2235 family)
MDTRNIVLFSDGTGNSAGKLFKTNVWRIYQALDLTDPQILTTPRQFAYYDDGVGTSTFKPLAMAGGAFGLGLARNVVDLYVFLCRIYRPGDRIYAFGFSRGAFTIRILVELVMTQGLLRYDGSEANLQRWAWDAYRAYRKERFQANAVIEASRWLRDMVFARINSLCKRTPYSKAPRIGKPKDSDEIYIEFLGLWDTVDAYGLPFDQLTRAIDKYLMPMTMRTQQLNKRVKCGRHALAVDDERRSFYPRLWNEANENTVGQAHLHQHRIAQVWFAGVHSNVGGGYPDDSLSYVPLLWIMDEAARCGLRFKNEIWSEFKALSDENGPVYDSRQGLASYYAYNPRKMSHVMKNDGVIIHRAKVHESLLRRIRVDPAGYAPTVLAGDFDVVRINGDVLPVENYLTLLSGSNSVRPVNTNKWLADYAAAQVEVFNIIWFRRVAYYCTVTISLLLLTMPAWAPGSGSCQASLCFLSTTIKALDYVIPSFATAWTYAFASSPTAFLSLLVLLSIFFGASTALDVSIRDKMRRIWYAIPPLKPKAVAPLNPASPPGALSRMAFTIRTHKKLRHAAFCVSNRILPIAFVAGIVIYTSIGATQLVFAARSSLGSICSTSAAGPWFATSEVCHNTGIQVNAGQAYKLTFKIPNNRKWYDASTAAGPQGFACKSAWYKALLMAAVVPDRRHPTTGWFQPMARIGESGNDVHELTGPKVAPRQLPDCDQFQAPGGEPAKCPAAKESPNKSPNVMKYA